MKKLIILFCLCLSSLSFAENKMSQSEIVSLIKCQIDLMTPYDLSRSFYVSKDMWAILTKYINMIDSQTITNDKYDNCIKDIIKEIDVYKKIINKLTAIQDNYRNDFSGNNIFDDIKKSDAIKECIDKLNEDVKNKVNELIGKLKD